MIRPFKNISPKIDDTVFVAGNATIIGDVEIAPNSSVWFGSIIRGDVHRIRIGARTNIQDGTIIHVTTALFSTTLEDEITVGHRAILHGCHIERNCLIGIGATVLDGVRIGAHSLVAANSLVTPNTNIPPRSFVLGSPARVKRELTDDEVNNLNLYWQTYVELSRTYLES